jgi:hypothetical protein
MRRFGHSKLTIQYFCSWEHVDLIGQTKRMFEVFHHLLERLMSCHPQPVSKCMMYCLGTCPNELEGRLLLICNRYRESGMIFWKWTFVKCFEPPNEFIDPDLDGLYHSVAETVLPFRLFHKQSLELQFQELYQVTINLHMGKGSNDSIAYDMAVKLDFLLTLHFPSFIWTFDEHFDQVSTYWKLPILIQGSYTERSNWIRPHWRRLQMIFEETWEDFKDLSQRSFEFVLYQRKRTYDFIQSPIDNFLPCNGIGQTFEFIPWKKNWKFKICSIAFYCKQRTHCQWGSHPFLSCKDPLLNEEDMRWSGSDCLTVRFVFQVPNHKRICDTFTYEAECVQALSNVKERELFSSILWIFGHAVEQCLMQQIENEVFDSLSRASFQKQSPFTYMEQLKNVYEAMQCFNVDRYPMRFPILEIERDTF